MNLLSTLPCARLDYFAEANCLHSHKYTQLPLIPVEQFLAEHPEHADADENALMTARIDHEHAGREALESQRQGLLKKKLGLVAENKKRKDDLAALDKDLETFIDVCILFHCLKTMLTWFYRRRSP